MSRSKILSSVLIAGGLFVSSALVSPAFAQKGTVMAPSTSWAVSQVDGQVPGAGYCALARRYNQNTILTFAQNRIGELSFALDFQRPRFDTTKSIDITLDAGAGEQRDFVITPASNKAFVVRLGRDEPFLEALKTTGYLRAEVDGYLYGFNLADIDDGRKALEECVENELPLARKAPEAESVVADSGHATEAAKPEAPRVAKAMSGDGQGITDVKTQLEKENRQLRLELQGKDIDHISEVNSLRAEIVRLQEQNERIKQQVDSLQENSTSELGEALEKMRESADTVGEFEARNESLLSQLSSTAKERDQLAASLKAAEEKSQSLRTELETLESAYMEQIEAIRLELAQQQTINADLRTSLDEGKYATAEQLKSVKQELLQAQDLLRSYEAQAGKVEERFEKKTTEYQDALAKVAMLEKENEELRASLNQSKAEYEESVADLRRNANALKGENETLALILKAHEEDKGKSVNLAVEARKGLESSLIELNKQHDETLAKLRSTEDQNAQLTAQLEEQKKAADKHKEELLAALEAAKQKNQSLKAGIVETNEVQASEAEELKGKIAGLQQEMVSMERTYAAQVQDLKTQLASRNVELEKQKNVTRSAVNQAENRKASMAAQAADTAASLPVPKAAAASDIVVSTADAMRSKASKASSDVAEKAVSTLPSSPGTVDLMKSSKKTATAVPQSPDVSSEALLQASSAPTEVQVVTEAQKMEKALLNKEMKSGNVQAKVSSPPPSADLGLQETTVTVRSSDLPLPSSPQMPKVQEKETYKPAFDVRPFIAQSSGTSLSAISKVDTQSDAHKAVYQWESNQIYGSLEQSPLPDSLSFEPRIQEYLEMTEERCDGEFAIIPDDSRQQGPARVDSYDIACIGKDVSSSASLLFIKKDNTFSVIAHEAAPENMETAMSLREKLISLMMGS